jgi:hypothetical protein
MEILSSQQLRHLPSSKLCLCFIINKLYDISKKDPIHWDEFRTVAKEVGRLMVKYNDCDLF